MITVHGQLAALNAAVESGALESLCRERSVDLLVLFGSALEAIAPGDIDLGVAFTHGSDGDLLTFLDALAQVVPGDHFDVMDLDRAGPVARHRALTRCRVLFASTPAAFYERQIFAINHYIETRPLREALVRKLSS
ncbi:MAG: hypothetical protein WBL05_02475 [Brooklawnia sp.]|uniref:hypothetical protein n=1 Tax=Brooklawnia sp. TaxID=2699740 RepID=UPI003C79455E